MYNKEYVQFIILIKWTTKQPKYTVKQKETTQKLFDSILNTKY